MSPGNKLFIFLRRPMNSVLLFCILLSTLFAHRIGLQIKYKDKIHHQVDTIPVQEFGVVLGAWVKEDHTLSDVTRERVEAGIQLYKAGKVSKLFFSGDNRSNQQAQAMADYAVENGVNPNDVIVDKLGIDTNDTCKHFAKIGNKAVLVTQGYHLPRTMLMCETSQIDVTGLAAEELDILSNRGDNLFQVYITRIWRSTREAALTWLFLLGIYDQLSTEAETLEQTK
jgi:vancomycin permeability regulator SanA